LSADAIRFEVIDDLPSVFADSVKFVSNDGEEVNYVHPDHLGAPQKMTDADRSVVWDASFLPFGEEDSLIGSAANDNRFPGQRLEVETGLHYNYFRDYDPTTGRYLQSDPIGLAGGINTYGYVSGNPVNYTDPDGQFAQALVFPAVGVGIAVCIYTNCTKPISDALSKLREMLNNLPNEEVEKATPGLGQCKMEDEDTGEEDNCEKLLRVDTDTCNGVTRSRGGEVGAKCHASATERYAACLRGKPIPPLNTYNN